MRLVVSGKTGQVATALREAGAGQGVSVIAMGRPELDLADPREGLFKIAEARPDVIVSAAAYTAVDKAETDADMARRVNAAGPAALAELAADLSIPIVHLSTDYVFDGSKPTPYVESDATNPLGVYGATKLAGERAIAAATDNHAILRTAWVYSPFGGNFLKTMLRLAETRSELRVVDDQRGNPTSALDLATAVIAVAKNLLARPDDAKLRGTFHVAGSGEASWADFAIEIFAVAKSLGGPGANVTRIGTADYPTPARRPANSRLDTFKLKATHGLTMPGWQASTRHTIERLLAGMDHRLEEQRSR
ncbi:MAG: dTDP-4-dehydrorhamnose reductase [Candidatus Devosia phytovorans]|uniref:dTDP-4-dehydrorhamnose reductase n=1 Tax=Candidatus Devosia phytovorans TaxID=3121372 RepID=A0AAJ5VS56_9HYPH|nr:dTDP-4-dehydrorhamnose reductase [Devosia sp.]WEK03734.1 MAG: dTDP-4-dehydrorhamnose reductase [Devosia sp.]